MRITKLCAKHDHDWCHRCGERHLMMFVEFTIPDNAEHSTADAKRGYFRICEMCVADFNRALAQPDEHASYGP